jgi:hypothetical protein
MIRGVDVVDILILECGHCKLRRKRGVSGRGGVASEGTEW